VRPEEADEATQGLGLAGGLGVVVDARLGPVHGQAQEALLEGHGIGECGDRGLVEPRGHAAPACRQAVFVPAKGEEAPETFDRVHVVHHASA